VLAIKEASVPPLGRDKLSHLVVVMLENRSFDHMLGALTAGDARIDGLTGGESNLDTEGAEAFVKPQAAYQGQLDPDPDHHFAAVDRQIFDGSLAPGRVATMGGFVKSYFDQQRDVRHSRLIMNYFKPEKLPVLTTLAREFALFNGWFASIPGPTLCNRAFMHYGSSFGHVDMTIFYPNAAYKSVYERLAEAGKTAKIYYFDTKSSTMEVVNLLQHQPQFFGLYEQFLDDCALGTLPDFCLIEPNYSDHTGDDGGTVLASDQHPDHDVREGERFLASIYNAIKANPALWESTAILVTYDEHGGIYDHVPPPSCVPDSPFVAQPASTNTGMPFHFDRLGVRVPALLISPWIARGTVVPGAHVAGGRVFEHASIPATATELFLGAYDARSPREKAAETFLDLISLDVMRDDTPDFVLA
jgi:phospholipase C